MRVAVIHYSEKENGKLENIAKALAKGIENEGHFVDVFNVRIDSDLKLTGYEYIAVGVEAISFFSSKINNKIPQFLKEAGTLTGKRSMAFIVPNGIFTGKTMQHIMKNMEHEGMFLKRGDVIRSDADAIEIGKRLHIKKN